MNKVSQLHVKQSSEVLLLHFEILQVPDASACRCGKRSSSHQHVFLRKAQGRAVMA
jgi:hypothetical protein